MSAVQYFQHYAANETALLTDFPALSWSHCLCLPAYDETTAFFDALAIAAKAVPRVLLILVINQPEHSAACANNQQLYQFFSDLPPLWKNQHLALHRHAALDILLVDRFSTRPIPVKNGVGMARKIAADIACFLQMQQQLQQPWFYCSDADVTFPPDYFLAVVPPQYSAAVLPFRHIASGNCAIDEASAIYEKSLQHYVSGLQSAGSPYAYHSIGSCLIIDCSCYIAVRGFPQKAGAEDFYLLNKLQKIRPVCSLSSPELLITSRNSDRVPFGTGPAVNKLITGQQTASDLNWPDAVFITLKHWLDYLNQLAEAGQFHVADNKHLQLLANQCALADTVAALFRQHKTAEKRRQHLHHWFDAAKTVKLLRQLKAEHDHG